MARRAAANATYVVPKWLRTLVDLWAARLGLDKSWHIKIIVKSLRDEGASSTWIKGYQTGVLTFDPKTYNEESEEYVEIFVIHELLHLVFARQNDAVVSMVGRAAAYAKYGEATEPLLDTLAKTLQQAYSRKRRSTK